MSKLTKTNAELVEPIAQLTKANETLSSKVNRAGVGNQNERRNNDPRAKKLCPHYKKEMIHAPGDCFKLEKNKDKRPWNWVGYL